MLLFAAAVNEMLLCYVVGCVVAAIGATVGGVVSLLMKWLSAGASLGTLIAIWIVLMDNGRLITDETRVVATFGVCIAVCIATSWHIAEVCATCSQPIHQMLAHA